MNKDYKKFLNNLHKSKTEEEVKNAYAKHFKIDYDTSKHHDLYTSQVLFEFKYDKNMDSLKARATVFAQILYYVHRLKYGFTQKPIPNYLCLADVNETVKEKHDILRDKILPQIYDYEFIPRIEI